MRARGGRGKRLEEFVNAIPDTDVPMVRNSATHGSPHRRPKHPAGRSVVSGLSPFNYLGRGVVGRRSHFDGVPGVSGVRSRPAASRSLGQIAIAVRAPSTVDDPGSHVVREVARVSFVVEGELLDCPVTGVELLEFVIEFPFATTSRTGNGRYVLYIVWIGARTVAVRSIDHTRITGLSSLSHPIAIRICIVEIDSLDRRHSIPVTVNIREMRTRTSRNLCLGPCGTQSSATSRGSSRSPAIASKASVAVTSPTIRSPFATRASS